MKTFSETVALLNEIVSEKPEGYAYVTDPKTQERQAQFDKDERSGTDCYYVHADGTPGCIVGNFIHAIKPEFDLYEIEFVGVSNALYMAGIRVDSDSHQLLADAQRFQDAGDTWETAVQRAYEINPAQRYLPVKES